MSVLHKLLEKLHLARHADVFDPEAVAREIEDKFKQEVADAVHALEQRVAKLEEQVAHPLVGVDLGLAPLPAAHVLKIEKIQNTLQDTARRLEAAGLPTGLEPPAPEHTDPVPAPQTSAPAEAIKPMVDVTGHAIDHEPDHAYGEDDASQPDHPDNHSAAGHDNGHPGDEHPDVGHGG